MFSVEKSNIFAPKHMWIIFFLMLVIYSGCPAFFDSTNNYNYFISKNVSVIQLLYHYEDKK